MILIALAAAVSDQSAFGTSMNRYIACLSAGIPEDLAGHDLQTRERVYRKAASRCQRERQEAIDVAVQTRRKGVSEDQAHTEAIDVIDTLDPMSSCKIAGAQC